jgi:hypothetical protein
MAQISIGDEVVHIRSGQIGTIREFITVDGEPAILVNDSTGQSLDTGFRLDELELVPHKDTALAQIIESVVKAVVPFALVLPALRSLHEGEQIEIGRTGQSVQVRDFLRLERLYYNVKSIEDELEVVA